MILLFSVTSILNLFLSCRVTIKILLNFSLMEEMNVKTFGKNVLRTIHFFGVLMLNKECVKSPKYLAEDHLSGINLNTYI